MYWVRRASNFVMDLVAHATVLVMVALYPDDFVSAEAECDPLQIFYVDGRQARYSKLVEIRITEERMLYIKQKGKWVLQGQVSALTLI